MSDYGSLISRMSAIFEPFERLGATFFDHRPTVAAHNYGYIFYHPLDDEALQKAQEARPFAINLGLQEFYRHLNGMHLNNVCSVYGFIAEKCLQPIDLAYGNSHEVPKGLPIGANVFGSVQLAFDRNGYLVAEADGTVSCLNSLLEYDVVNRWPTIYDAIVDHLPI